MALKGFNESYNILSYNMYLFLRIIATRSQQNLTLTEHFLFHIKANMWRMLAS